MGTTVVYGISSYYGLESKNFYGEFGTGREPRNFYLLFFPIFFIFKKLILGEKKVFYSLIYTFGWVGICISDYVQP